MLSLWTGTWHLWKPLATAPTKGPERQRPPSSETKQLSRSTHPVRLRERNVQPADPLFRNARGQPLSRDGVQYILTRHVEKARAKCPSLKTKRVSPHVLRHSTAMNLLQHGVDRSVIAMWLGHESMDTTQMYLHANIELKEKALAKTEPFRGQHRRYRPPDQLLAFLQAL